MQGSPAVEDQARHQSQGGGQKETQQSFKGGDGGGGQQLLPGLHCGNQDLAGSWQSLFADSSQAGSQLPDDQQRQQSEYRRQRPGSAPLMLLHRPAASRM